VPEATERLQSALLSLGGIAADDNSTREPAIAA